MTGLTETEHVVSAFDAGGIDYVIKPIKPGGAGAHSGAHARARQARQAAMRSMPLATLPVTISLKDGRLP